jgi:hypothetical protein
VLSAMKMTATLLAGTAAFTVSQVTPSNSGSLTGSTLARKPSGFSRCASSLSCRQAPPLVKSVRTRNEYSTLGNVGMAPSLRGDDQMVSVCLLVVRPESGPALSAFWMQTTGTTLLAVERTSLACVQMAAQDGRSALLPLESGAAR